ncbi:hypothetical protein N7513_004798 [Penicillium frequentans]|uniref:Uncharacterized protein n=1 Tax=Penicillium frequentans TaxID=3151616 RepID=A0AAD6GC09_9EURO|nr:hypothetical protein N7494_009957 [Penicillium glabrum]KAJ5547564.1 hypothetical protein N7513_004798 [Penicillium glabrum]
MAALCHNTHGDDDSALAILSDHRDQIYRMVQEDQESLFDHLVHAILWSHAFRLDHLAQPILPALRVLATLSVRHDHHVQPFHGYR